MELLRVLWDGGPQSLSEVHEALGDAGYTTVQTRLNRLVEKGLAAKSKVGRQPTKYAAAVEPEEITAPQLDSLVEGVTGGSVVPLVAHLVGDESLTPDQLREIKRLIREAEQRLKKQAEDS